ncbi:MAG TPA: hypothetical protein VMF52_14435 [Steroidobacteraceae bacterium]|nr:hypothetical protein [Steroidobacteraceae bacterium]
MTGHDDEFEDFLRRRRPMFGRADDALEPPAELDRVVLRQAREAIEGERPQRLFRAPGWGMPVALAATLVLAFTVILRVEAPPKAEPRGEVTVQAVSRQVEMSADSAAPAAAPAVPMASSAPAEARRFEKLADAARPAAPPFVSEAEAARYSQPMAGRSAANDARVSTGVVIDGQRADVTPDGELRSESVTAAASAPAAGPAYRREAKTWLAEIERLRAEGDVLRADAELAEYKRQHRAYAVAPDR